MGINWSAVAGGIGEAVNYHVDKRDEERKRKKAFQDATAMAEINFGYNKTLAEIGAKGTVDAAKARLVGKGKGNVFNLPDLGQWGAPKEIQLSGTTDTIRFDQKQEAVSRHFGPMIKALTDGNGSLSVEDAEDLLKSKGGSAFLAQFVGEQFRKIGMPYAKEGRAFPSNKVMFGNLVQIPSILEIANGFRDGEITAAQAAQRQTYDSQVGPKEVGVPTWRATFLNGKPIDDQNPQGATLASSQSFREVGRQLKGYSVGDSVLDSSEDVDKIAISILGDTAKLMTGVQIKNAVLDGLQLGRQRNQIVNGMVVPNSAHTIIRDSETANTRIDMSKMLLESLTSGIELVLTRKPLVTGGGVATQSLLARLVGGGREIAGDIVGLVDEDTKSFNLGESDALTKKLVDSLGNSIVDKDAIVGTLNEANNKLKEYMEKDSSKKADGSGYTDVALATYQLRMEQTFIAYQVAKFFGDSRVSNADFKNAFDAMFGTFEEDPDKQRKAFAIGMMRLHFLVGKQVEDDDLQTRFARSLDPANPKVMYDTSANSGAREYLALHRKTTQALVSNNLPDEYFDRILPGQIKENRYYRPFAQPDVPEVNLTVEELGSINSSSSGTQITEVDATPKRK
tara:strand:+ start:1190 stop:3058 length:1869 start_codon:yes stop_codon:yes gene_type:complete